MPPEAPTRRFEPETKMAATYVFAMPVCVQFTPPSVDFAKYKSNVPVFAVHVVAVGSVYLFFE